MASRGPQVGLLAMMSSAYSETTPYPLDVLDSETEGQIGYVLELALDNAVPDQETVAALPRVVVDARDPAFSSPSKRIGLAPPSAAWMRSTICSTARRHAGAAGRLRARLRNKGDEA